MVTLTAPVRGLIGRRVPAWIVLTVWLGLGCWRFDRMWLSTAILLVGCAALNRTFRRVVTVGPVMLVTNPRRALTILMRTRLRTWVFLLGTVFAAGFGWPVIIIVMVVVFLLALALSYEPDDKKSA